ncbi:hypothetical protein [Methylibium petroleiphilum]|uniref:Uncharacterized protein n=1 Tax=Methylibium petroleiphilum (strain ATCC BAA-1232 / LMG 22953 / PM1) TaxID=420662 RepID=A2SF27_METPP|nr:hypothetical protein [Methylibium petroleiphilum]ABM94166.1 hypothetical protein Mpe_A1203 [Methylibium petroleiphilum PM1]ABM96976.1 hypothetical protein Mpe_B0200 [Methylibium petroleiphilum PM1]
MTTRVAASSKLFDYVDGVILLPDEFQPDKPIKVDLNKMWLPATPFSKVEPIAQNPRLSAFVLDAVTLICRRRKKSKSKATDVAGQIRTIVKFIEFLYVEGIYAPSECDKETIRILLTKLVAGGWSEALRLQERTLGLAKQLGVRAIQSMTSQPKIRDGICITDRVKRHLGTNCSGPETAAVRRAIRKVLRLDQPSTRDIGGHQLKSSTLFAIFDVVNLASDLPEGRGLTFVPFPDPFVLSNKLGLPNGRTRNMRPEHVGTLLKECFAWIYTLAEPLVALLNTIADELSRSPPKDSGARADLVAKVLAQSADAARFQELSGMRIRNIRCRVAQNPTECTLSEAIDCLMSACFVTVAFFNARRKDEIQHPVIGLKDDSLRPFDVTLDLYVCSFYLEKFTKDYRDFFVNDATVAAVRVLHSASDVERRLNQGHGPSTGRSLFRVPTVRAKHPLTSRTFQFSRSRSARRLLRRAFGASAERLAYASHMGRRAYGLIMINRYSSPSLLALSQQYDHHGRLDVTNIYLSDPMRGNTLDQLEGFGRLRLPPAEVIADLEATVADAARERLAAIVNSIVRGTDSLYGGFTVFVNRLHARIASRMTYDDVDLRAATDLLTEALLRKGHKVVPFRHGDCCASDARSATAKCSRGSGRPRRENASPKTCSKCPFHARSPIHAQAMTLGIANLRRRLSELPVGGKLWKQMTAEITELEQAVADAQARPGSS